HATARTSCSVVWCALQLKSGSPAISTGSPRDVRHTPASHAVQSAHVAVPTLLNCATAESHAALHVHSPRAFGLSRTQCVPHRPRALPSTAVQPVAEVPERVGGLRRGGGRRAGRRHLPVARRFG